MFENIKNDLRKLNPKYKAKNDSSSFIHENPSLDFTKNIYKTLETHEGSNPFSHLGIRDELTKQRNVPISPKPTRVDVAPKKTATPRVNRKEADDITARLNKASADWTAAHPYQAKKTGGTIKGGFQNSHFMKECRKHKGA